MLGRPGSDSMASARSAWRSSAGRSRKNAKLRRMVSSTSAPDEAIASVAV
jgi:hypothetical protein